MPTVGWVLEDAIERFWEGQPRAIFSYVRPEFPCSQCGKILTSLEDLRRHVSLAHPLDLPKLYVFGKPLQREHVIRSPVSMDDVQLLQCSHCEVQIDGAPPQRLTGPVFCTQFSRFRNATLHVRLIHERSVDASHSIEEYVIRFRIPDIAALNAIDARFIRTLALEALSHADLERFATGLHLDAPAREYGSALGDYALGVILKERRRRPSAPVGFEEFAVKMHTALEVLRLFPNRPVALAVVKSICFNLNAFHDDNSAPATDLDVALQFFRRAVGTAVVEESATGLPLGGPFAATQAICPVDQVSHRMLVACNRLTNAGGMPLSDLEELQHLNRGAFPISEQDLAKIHVICATGYRQLGHTEAARTHLKAIQFDASFSRWAQHQLEELANYGS